MRRRANQTWARAQRAQGLDGAGAHDSADRLGQGCTSVCLGHPWALRAARCASCPARQALLAEHRQRVTRLPPCGGGTFWPPHRAGKSTSRAPLLRFSIRDLIEGVRKNAVTEAESHLVLGGLADNQTIALGVVRVR